MKAKAARSLLLFVAMATLFAPATNSCSFSYDPVFFFALRPPAPMSAYVAGNLGVVLPTYARSHLVVAWRYLSGKPLNETERKEMLAYYEPRIDRGDYYSRQPPPNPVDTWVALRNSVVPASDRPPYNREGLYFSDYVNCTDDAFRTATKTLQSHIDELGTHHPAVVAWVNAQNAVFSNCAQRGATPPPADASMPAVFRRDRAYQIASAAFYAGDFDRAHDAFLAVSRDPQSPWRRIARIVAARALIRKGVLVSGDQLDEAALNRASEELHGILTDADMRPLYRAAGELDDYVGLHIAPQKENVKLAGEIASGHLTTHNVTDYVSSIENDDVKATDDMSDWIRTFHAESDDVHVTRQEVNEAAFDRAHERWQSTHAVPWLVAAITFATKESKGLNDLLAAASQVDAHSPAWLTVTYQRVRLLLDRGEKEEARRALDAVLAPATKETLPTSTENLFRAQRLPLARSLDAFVRDASRTVVGDSLQTDSQLNAEVLFDDDAAIVINTQMPLSSLLAAAHLPDVSPGIRNQLVVAAFTRAIVLGKPEVAQELVPELHKEFDDAENPRSDEDLKDMLDRFAASPPSRRRVAAIDLLIHMPGLSPFVMSQESRVSDSKSRGDALTESIHSSMHENWWCIRGVREWEMNYPEPRRLAFVPPPPFVQPLLDESAAEQKALQISGPSFVLRGALIWAKEYPDDPRLPESLSLAIKETEWSCPDASTRKLARSAFNLLHSRYGKTKAAKSTKYWYDGNG